MSRSSLYTSAPDCLRRAGVYGTVRATMFLAVGEPGFVPDCPCRTDVHGTVRFIMTLAGAKPGSAPLPIFKKGIWTEYRR